MKKFLLSIIVGITIVFNANAQGWQQVGKISLLGSWTTFPSLAFSPAGEPYVAYSSSSSGKINVAKFDGTNWITVGSPEFSYGPIWQKSLAFSPTGEPYVAYSEIVSHATVKKFDGVDWVTVGVEGFSAGEAEFSATSLAFSPKGEPYVAYYDRHYGGGTVMKFDGVSWINVGATRLSTTAARFTSLAFSPIGEPYVAYQDMEARATVKKFDGTNWISLGAPEFSEGWAYYISLAFNKTGEPYVAYSDYGKIGGGLRKANVMKFNGTNWVIVGQPDFSTGGEVGYISLAFSPSEVPYVSYWNPASNDDNGATVMKFNGTDWVNVGNPGFSGKTVSGGALSLAISPEGEPYVVCTWLDSSVMKFVPTIYTITTSVQPGTGGTVNGGGEYEEGASVTLTATPNANYQFVKWTENGVDISMAHSYTFTVNGNRTLIAEFEPGTGIDGLYIDKSVVAVYPNPTHNVIHFSISAHAELTNITGQTIASGRNVNSLDISSQLAGIYFITLTNDKGEVLQRSKIIKE